jgi:hypothetical protein
MSEKKVVKTSVAIALGIIAIILLVGLVAVIADYSLQISSLNSKVNDLNSIVNFKKGETWLSNKTFTINPNQNFSEQFYAPLSGNVEVVGYFQPSTAPVQPASPGIWTNLTWWVLYGVSYSYKVSPSPYGPYLYGNSFEEEFPIVSFAQAWINPNVLFQIGNSWTEPVTVNLTITIYY